VKLDTPIHPSKIKQFKPMKLESTAFAHEGTIPTKHTCDGGHFSPPLSWSEVPEGTRSFVLIMDDPDAVAVSGKVFDHWVLYDLPPETRQLAEGLPTDQLLPDGSTHGITSRRAHGYFGPCPPHGTHRYFFSLFALNQPLGLEPGKTKAEILQAIAGHILARAELVGLYNRET
jgi:Raf kinase inhibitor-like YbhB/YbcL family protein